MKLGTRGSPLALAQAELVRRAFLDRFPDREVEVVAIRTTGDEQPDRPLSSFGGEGVFATELESALLDGRIDVAVHSAKDLAVDDRDDLELAAFLEREEPYDVLVRAAGKQLAAPGPGFRVGTGSSRRRTQLADVYPGVEFVEIRGNVETRLDKLARGDADAVVLAAAGLRRLGLAPEGEEPLAISTCVPAPGQGAVVAQARRDDPVVADLRWINHFPTALAVQVERDVARALGAGCDLPLGCHVEFRAAETRLSIAYFDGERLHRVEARSPAGAPEEALEGALADLRERGARWRSVAS